MKKIVHIHAKCNAFEIYEQIPEEKAVNRLIRIRRNFEWFKNRKGFIDDHLTVKTKLVNPEFMFQ